MIDYKFSGILGKVYQQGNLLFSGDCVLSAVGNRIISYDLVRNQSFTYPFETIRDVYRFDRSADGILIVTDVDGRGIAASQSGALLCHFNFKARVECIKFSPCGKYIAITHENEVQVWKSPSMEVELLPLSFFWKSTVHNDKVKHISWSQDSQCILTCSDDMTARVFTLSREKGARIRSQILAGHKGKVVGGWFGKNLNEIYTVGKDAFLYFWKPYEITGEGVNSELAMNNVLWRFERKHSFRRNYAEVTSCSFHESLGYLIAGLSNGEFFFWKLPSLEPVISLSVSQSKITAIAINETGEWLAFGCSNLAMLLVWEWKSESYVFRQQGHRDLMSCLAYSHDGQFIATGGDDCKVKIWDAKSKLCFVTFANHTSKVTAMQFARRNLVFSASLDGSVRAYDLIRYRNFKTFTSPKISQFSSLDVSPNGEVVCAGTSDGHEVYVWSVQTGKILEVLSGHEAPVSSLAFDPLNNGIIATASWDKTVKLWSLYSTIDEQRETLKMESEALCVAFRPDGNVIACATLNGDICMWDIANAEILGIIEGRKHITPGRFSTDRRAARNKTYDQHFTTLCYSSDGSLILAAGKSPYVCLYSADSKVLLKRFKLSNNMSLGGLTEKLNSGNLTEAGPLDLIDTEGENEALENRQDDVLPGVSKRCKDPSKRQATDKMIVFSLKFSPTSSSFSCATTEGLIIFSLNAQLDTFFLDLNITPTSILETLNRKDYLRSFLMALRLGDLGIIDKVCDAISASDVELLCKLMPNAYLGRALSFLAHKATSMHIHKCLLWYKWILTFKGMHIKENFATYSAHIRTIQKLMPSYENLAGTFSQNTYQIKYLIHSCKGNYIPNAEHAKSVSSENV